MDKTILVQYCEMKEEVKDIRARIGRVEKSIANLCIVSDSVKGTRKDGTYGSIKITGYPTPEHDRKKKLLERQRALLVEKETELLELMTAAEEYIENVEKPEMRMILRFSVIDNLTNIKVAECMNRMFPERKVRYTDENVKKRLQRFFEKI